MVTITGLQSFSELARTTLGSANAQIAVTNLPAKQWLLVLCDLRHTASLSSQLRLNADSTTKYSDRISVNGGADTTSASAANNRLGNTEATNSFIVIWIETLSTGEKLIQAWGVGQNTAGVANVPDRIEMTGKWANTANAVTEIDIRASTSTFATGSEVVVLGSDPADVAVTPFFTEQSRALLSSANATVSVSGLTSQKYIMCQIFSTGRSSATNRAGLRFNADSGSNYANRFSLNGAADTTEATQTGIRDGDATTVPQYFVYFVLNIQANEKLVIQLTVHGGAAGAATAPSRFEGVGKWTNTSNNITEVGLTIVTSGTYNTSTMLIVYGNN